MSYGFTDDHIETGQPFPLSECVEDVTLEHCEYVGKDTWEAISFTFKKDSLRLTANVFAVNEDNVKPYEGLTLEDTIKKQYTAFNTKLWHIADAFKINRTTLQDACAGKNSFKAFADAYCEILNRDSVQHKVYLKTVLNKKGYVSLPNYPTFIQNMDDECSLRYSAREIANNQKFSAPKKAVEKIDEEPSYDDTDWLDEL